METITKLEGKISYLIPFDENHLNDKRYLAWLHDYDVIKTIGRLEYVRKPVSFKEVKRYYESVLSSKADIFWALYYKEGDEFIGTVKISKINQETKSADIGILIGDKPKWGKGVATDAVRTVGKYLFDTLKMRKLTSGTMAINIGMVKVFEKLGFKREGVFRKQNRFEDGYCDHIYFGCFRDEFKDNAK
jgi:RimJ/RimL family protein N-acetyltransferase